MSQVMTTDFSTMPINDTTEPPSDQDDSPNNELVFLCHRQDIPGLVSNDSSRQLSQMHINYVTAHGYISIVICVIGVLFNSASIVVFTRKHMASSTNILLTWIAIVDFFKMLCYIPFALHFYVLQPVDPESGPFHTSEYAWIHFLIFYASFPIVCHHISIWLTIALAIFRYIYISVPTRSTYYCSKRRAKLVVILVIIFTTLACAPNSAVITYKYNPGINVGSSGNIAGGNVSTTISSTDIYYVNTTATPISSDGGYYLLTHRKILILVQINFWIQAILLKLIPCFMLTVLTLLLVNAITRAYRKRLKLTNSQLRREGYDRQDEHNRTTRMLLAVVVLFTVAELPHGILFIMNIVVGPCFMKLVYNKLGELLDLMVLVNGGLNFVLYCSMSRQFRHTFVRIFQQTWLDLSTMISLTEGATSKSSRRKYDTSVTTRSNACKSESSVVSSVRAEKSPPNGRPLEIECSVGVGNGSPVD